jgi:hypothetical protein
MRFEQKHQPLANRWQFVRRMLLCTLLSVGMVAVSLALGVIGYRHFGRMSWIDALLNASMILAGMGPVTELKSTDAKLFASFYALFSGVVLLGSVAVILSPVFHRVMHRFHLADEDLEA